MPNIEGATRYPSSSTIGLLRATIRPPVGIGSYRIPVDLARIFQGVRICIDIMFAIRQYAVRVHRKTLQTEKKLSKVTLVITVTRGNCSV